MGIHEWLLKKGKLYEVDDELRSWLVVYRDESERAANEQCDRLFLSRPVAYRSIAPTGSFGILASTTTGIEPLYAVAFNRRYLTDGVKWKYEYVVDSTADHLIKEYDVDPTKIETPASLATDFERRIRFQADVQEYVDMAISSTINLPSWGSRHNCDDRVVDFATLTLWCMPTLSSRVVVHLTSTSGVEASFGKPLQNVRDSSGILDPTTKGN